MTNVGSLDRILRLVLGIALIVIPFVGGFGLIAGVTAKIIAVAIGVVLSVTALFGVCPLYSLFGIRTCRS
ncbi:MAG: DUF2892 domain-containing protein [Hyphomicrobiales bacterium]|nr:DUF2892 domain-containing protein [Hyphomicrobiales bacterium]